MKPFLILSLQLFIFFFLIATFGETVYGVARMEIYSSAFKDKEDIPQIYTCEGSNVSPPLTWKNVPPQTKSLVLIVDDPDAPDPAAPKRTWVHWVIYNLPPSPSSLTQGLRSLPASTKSGLNDWKREEYRGPCPPIGSHRYFFKLYALDTFLQGLVHPTKSDIEKFMKSHVLAHAELIGIYKKRGQK